MDDLLIIADQFEQLALSLAALKALHAENPGPLASLENAERKALRGARLARSHIRTGR